jgi:hypothetical protein
MSKLLRVAVCLSLLAAALCAQTGVGQIQGTISDASGAVVPNASVLLENIQTDNPFRTVTNEAGLYVFPSLTPGDYRLTVTAPGMQKWEGKATLVAGQRAVISVSLEVGRSTEQITVAGDVTPLLSTSSPTVATVVERARIEQLPLNGRSIQTLLSIAVPGLEGSTSQPKVYGLRDSAMDVLQDGVTLQDRNTGAIQSRPPGLDTNRRVPCRNGGIQRQANTPRQRHDDHQERHERGARFDIRNRPQQRLRRRPAATGHLHQGATSRAQRIRRIARRPGVSTEDL